MIDEPVWVAGDTKNLLVVLRNAPGDTTHYYYYPGELTPPKIVKWVDIEPLRKHGTQLAGRNSPVFLSRVHYWGLVLWLSPTPKRKSEEEKPVCVFENNYHTPYLVYDQAPEVKILRLEDLPRLGKWDWLQWRLASSHFAGKVPSVSASAYDEYPAILGEEKPEAVSDSQQLFDISSILNATRYLILVGPSQDVQALESRLVDYHGIATRAKLEEFLRAVGVG